MVRITGIIFLILCIAAPTAFAGGAGNCIEPIRKTTKYLGVGAGVGYNFVSDRMNKMENKRGARDMELKNISQIYGKGIVGLGDYVNLYGKAGGTNYDLKFVAQSQNATMEIGLQDGLYTGVGLNALFPITKIDPVSIGIGFDIQGNFSYNKVSSIKRSGQTARSIGGAFYSVDGQNSLYLTCKYDVEKIYTSFIPYIGGYQSWAVAGTAEPLSYDTTSTGYVYHKHFQGAYDVLSFGLLVGVDVDVAKYIALNVEGRFIGETAITTGATVKF